MKRALFYLLFSFSLSAQAICAATPKTNSSKPEIVLPQINPVLSPDEFSKKNLDASSAANKKLNSLVQEEQAKQPKITTLPPLPSNPDDAASNNASSVNTNPPATAPNANSQNSNAQAPLEKPLPPPAASSDINKSNRNMMNNPTPQSTQNNNSPWIGSSNQNNSSNSKNSGKQSWGIKY